MRGVLASKKNFGGRKVAKGRSGEMRSGRKKRGQARERSVGQQIKATPHREL